MKKRKGMRIKHAQYVPLIFILVLVMASQPVYAGGEDAQLGDATLSPTPYSQGEGGSITLELDIPFYSGCCYPLYAYDVTADLSLPRNVDIISGPEPSKISKVEAAAGGEPTWVKIKWTVKSLIAGEYTIDVTVNTQNCGSTSTSSTIEVTKGCVISIPEIYPKEPSTEKNLYINIEAMSPIEGVFIEDATIYYVNFGTEKSNVKSENETLYYGKTKSVEGTPLVMEPVEDRENFFEIKVPKQSTATYMHYWVVATDNRGNRTTSPVYSQKIEDMDHSNFVLTLAVWTPLILTIIGIISMILLSRHFKKIDEEEEGLLVLGSTKISNEEASKNFQKRYQRRSNLVIYTIFGALFAVGVLLFIWALITNQLGDLIYVVGGGM
jgi:hypothetical protein